MENKLTSLLFFLITPVILYSIISILGWKIKITIIKESWTLKGKVKNLLHEGRKIQAIKLVWDSNKKTNKTPGKTYGLLDARYYVENVLEEMIKKNNHIDSTCLVGHHEFLQTHSHLFEKESKGGKRLKNKIIIILLLFSCMKKDELLKKCDYYEFVESYLNYESIHYSDYRGIIVKYYTSDKEIKTELISDDIILYFLNSPNSNYRKVGKRLTAVDEYFIEQRKR